MEKNLKCINDLLPLELIRAILLRIPVKHLGRAKCVSKLWNTLISDRSFAKSHLDHSLAPTHTYILIEDYYDASSIDLDALLLQDNQEGVDEVSLSIPFVKKPPSRFHFLGSCRGLLLLHREPQFLILWNPLIDSSKRISYSHMVNAVARKDRDNFPKVFNFLDDALLYGFGYDASRDDYIVVVAYKGKDGENHFDMYDLGTKSWINLDAALPKPMSWFDWKSQGLFCNGAIHWINYYDGEEILSFDLKERTFSKISLPEHLTHTWKCRLVLLGGCLAVYSLYEEDKTEIWVMKEYKVQTSWTLYEIPLKFFKPLCLSGDGDIIIGRRYTSHDVMGFYIYNVSGEPLKPVQYFYTGHCNYITYHVYTDSLMPIPNKTKEKKMKKDHRNHKQVKRIRTDQM